MLNFDPPGDNIEILKADSCGQWVDRIPVYTLTMYIYIYTFRLKNNCFHNGKCIQCVPTVISDIQT